MYYIFVIISFKKYTEIMFLFYRFLSFYMFVLD